MKRSVGVSMYNARVTSYLYFILCMCFRRFWGPIMVTTAMEERSVVVRVRVVRLM